MEKNYFCAMLSCLLMCLFAVQIQAQSLSATYNSGDIPTAFSSYEESCNGVLTITLPATSSGWEVTGFDVEYDMTTGAGAWLSEQNSRIHFQNNGNTEPNNPGTGGNTAGTASYSRTGLTIANGYYTANANLMFEMQAYRTWGGSGCNTTYNKVDDGTWEITVYYQAPTATCISPLNVTAQNIGPFSAEIDWDDINTTTPSFWDIEYGTAGFSPTGTPNVTPSPTTSPYTLSSLSSDTAYDFYIKPDCGTTWEGPYSFSTTISCQAPTNVQTGNATTTSVDVTWVDNNSTPPASWNIEYGAPGFAQGSGTTQVVTSSPATINSLTLDTDYEFYIQADCGTSNGTSSWVGPFAFSTTIDCSAFTLDVTSSTDANVVCKGTATLTATATGNGDDIYWYDAAAGGNIVGTGNSFTTPIISTTTSYWAAEIKMESGSGGATPVYCVPTYPTGCTVGDDIDDFDMSSAGISHTGTGCSAAAYSDYTGDASLVGVMNIGSTYNFSATHNFGSQYLKIWIDLDQDGTFSASELLFTSSAGSNNTTGSITIPAANGGATVMRVMGRFAGAPTDACNPGGTYGETHDYKVIISDVACESVREEVVATVSTAGDITINSLPYSHTDDTANYSDPFEGPVGTNCGSDQNYLNGNNVVYKYTPANDVKVDIKMSGLNGFYSGVFVYDSCADVGVTCLTGKAAGPSDDDYVISDYDLTAGEDYYFVVSSWLNPTVGYTFEIIPFDCAALSTPTGPANQDFVAGETLADLEADVTKPTATLQWYSDAAATNPIPDTTTLVDATTYYVVQDFDGCESAPLAITVSEIDCTTLDIVSSTGDSVSCQGSMILTATASGTGSDIYWFDAASGGNVLYIGDQFVTPALTTTTSYWVAEVLTDEGSSGSGLANYCTPTSTNCSAGDHIDDFVMNDAGINHLGTGCPGASYSDFSNDPSLLGVMVPGNSYTFNITHNFGNQYIKIWIDFNGDGDFDDSNELLFTSSAGANPTSGSITIPVGVSSGLTKMRVTDRYAGTPTGPCNGGGSFGETHDYGVVIGSVVCESPREEVVATVTQTGDEDVDYTDLPYSQSATTATYGNNFSGDAGGSCPGSSILDGNDVVYKYTADPTNDDILNFEASGLTNADSGMYLYTSCGEVGTNCLEGVENDGSGNAFINDYYVNAGEEIFIVISSASSTTNYTLDIYGLDCNNIDLPTGDSPQDFVAGDFVSDLEVDTSQFNSDVTWYSDAALTIVINDPTTEALVDGEIYYVTQTILGCESDALAITAEEVDCSALDIISASDVTICAPGGQVALSATPTGSGSDIFWYTSPTAPNPVGIGANFSPSVSTTTSFWVAEVFLSESTGNAGPLPTYCFPAANCGSGDDIDGFTLEDSSGSSLISHTATGCSSGTNGDYTGDANLTTTLVSGQSYNFTVFHNFGGQYVKIWIDFNKDGDFDDADELLFQSAGGANPTNGSFTIPASALGNETVMRVRNKWNSLPATSCSTESFSEIHDYKVVVLGAAVICESSRNEVVVTVNDQPTSVPTGNATQSFCEDARVSDLNATGVDVQWYATDTSTQPLDINSVLLDGETYYATQTVDACESETRLAVTIEVLDDSPMPIGDKNQAYVSGQTVVDLVVQGDNLTWYEDSFGLNQITDPSSTSLEDQESYYVSQTPAGQCESELLEITVHSLLSVNDDPIFDGLSYYPNPMKDNLHVMHTQVIDEFVIYNMLGQQVMRNKTNTSKFDIQVSDLASGTYFMQLKIDDKSGIFKLIKE